MSLTASYTQTFKPSGPGSLRDEVLLAAEVLSFEVEKETGEEIVLSCSVNLWSWGETITVDLSDPELVTVTSKCVWPLQVFDWQKNRQNVENLISKLKRPGDTR